MQIVFLMINIVVLQTSLALASDIGPYFIFGVHDSTGTTGIEWAVAFVAAQGTPSARILSQDPEAKKLPKTAQQAAPFFGITEGSIFTTYQRKFLAEKNTPKDERKQAMKEVCRDSSFAENINKVFSHLQEKHLTPQNFKLALVLDDNFYWQLIDPKLKSKKHGPQFLISSEAIWSDYDWLDPERVRKKRERTPETQTIHLTAFNILLAWASYQSKGINP